MLKVFFVWSIPTSYKYINGILFNPISEFFIKNRHFNHLISKTIYQDEVQYYTMNEESPKTVYIECPQCHELIALKLNNIVFDREYAKIVYTHGKFGVKPHSIIIDLDKNYVARQVTVADKTFTKIG